MLSFSLLRKDTKKIQLLKMSTLITLWNMRTMLIFFCLYFYKVIYNLLCHYFVLQTSKLLVTFALELGGMPEWSAGCLRIT